ncbi:Glycerophosphoryl diester phosphodiesterase [Pseudonocardia sp. Ae168_Ps1]|uniref:glycerophosphodiester phosphodiesterase n=1 Tax=unclassified Pseudonocardia TaxID=2619320 RepID=UPI0009651E0F|nr:MULTISPECIES: glycerophosphodiester phosphodiesterase family protein [unclassified Pseudonocardia]OLL71302.1 Glycerophosphoryl diester phosphodiesterase [Pseudonocardia sp. Ae168_Ps1]
MRPLRRVLGTLLPVALVPAALLALAPSAVAEPQEDGPEVVAHRGASGDAPENTLAAVDEAVAQKADSVEIDVQRTADGRLVLLHDGTLTRTTDVEQVFPARALAPVGSFTLDELKQLDAGSWFGPEFAGERIPTFDEFVERAGDRAGLLIELKDPATYPGIEKEVAAALGEPRPGVVVQSFDHDAMLRFAEAAPGIPAGWLYETRPTAAELDEAKAAGVDQVNPSFRNTDAALVGAVRERGMETGVYTVNEEADMRRMLDAGVDRIITDHPGVLRGVLGG